jgi:alpha-ribazole phosphatase
MEKSKGCTIYLLRHGHVENSDRNCFNGHFDADLSTLGLEQSQKVAQRLSCKPIKAVYSSDLRRSLKGAHEIGKLQGIAPESFKEFREISVGKWEGLTLDEVNNKYPGEIEQRFKNIVTSRVEGGETIKEVHNRVIPKFITLALKHLDETIAIVAHGGVNRIILCHLLGIPWKNIYRLKQGFTCINLIHFYQDNPIVEFINSQPDANIDPSS